MKALVVQDAGQLLFQAGFSATADFIIRIKDDRLLARVAVHSVIDDFFSSMSYSIKDPQYEKEQKELEEKIAEFNRQFPNCQIK